MQINHWFELLYYIHTEIRSTLSIRIDQIKQFYHNLNFPPI